MAQKGHFPMVPEGDFNCRPTGPQIAEICIQKAPRPRFAQKSRFPMVQEGDFNCRLTGPQIAEVCYQNPSG